MAHWVKNLPANAEDAGSMPPSGRSPEGGNGNPFQYSCVKNLMDKRAWWPQSVGLQRVRLDLVTEQQLESN